VGDKSKHEETPWRDEETLREEYVHKQRSSTELAEEWGCSGRTVWNWARKHGFIKYSELPKFTLGSPKTEERPDGSRKSAAGYERHRVMDSGGSGAYIYHHRLLAVAEWGLDAVRDMDVHHKNSIPWDNRPDNLELLTKAEHAQEHQATEMVNGEPWYAEDNLHRLYYELEWSTTDIADEYDVRSSTVREHMDKHGMERRSMSDALYLQQQDSQQQTLDSFSESSTGDD
jgi:hypothetical protein